VYISLTSLDDELKRILEPRAAAPAARLRAIRVLRDNHIPVGVLCAPMIPMINDMELEQLLSAAKDAGAQSAGYMLLRLPREVAPLFEEWLQNHYPQRAEHVLSLIRQSRGGELYDSRFGHRFRGQGAFADLLAQRFALAIRKLRLNQRDGFNLDCSRFCPPGGQLALL
jgi:DNA repair photolyase